MANKKKPSAKTTSGAPRPTNPGSASANRPSSSGAGTNGNGPVGMANEVQWNRRKAWPLLLGSAAVLGGASVANYHWANPDGKLTTKAQDALAAVYPGAKVRVHGRDAIITDLPAGADRKVAHDLVRRIEGVRHVKQQAGGLVPADSSVAPSASDTTVAAPASAPDPIVGDTVVAQDSAAVADNAAVTTVPPETTVSSETTVAAGVAPADSTVAASAAGDTGAPPADTAATATVAPDTAPVVTAPAETAPSTAEVPTTAAPATAGTERPLGAVEPFRFASGSANLDADATAALAALADTLTQNPDAHVSVVGHADSRGTRLGNLAISRQRADAVVDALVRAGIDRTRITSVGKGARLPVAPNDTDAGRAANRRVDIVVIGAAGAGNEVSYTG